MEPFDVAIVGAGIVGSACARELAREGLRVAIIDPAPAAGTTSAGMGHIVVMEDSPAQLALSGVSRQLWQAEPLPVEAEYVERGTIWVAADDAELAEAQVKHDTFRSAGMAARMLTPDELRTLEPNLRAGLAGGLLVPGDAVCSPPAAAACFLAEAERLGATLSRQHVTAAANGMVTFADGGCLQAAKIILATGVECALLPALPLRKRKGHLVITASYPGFAQHQLVELGYLKSAHEATADSVAFNLQPRKSGQLVIGSSRQFDVEDPAPEPAILEAMLARATLYMPALAGLTQLRSWTGFRAATPDKLPLIGPASGLSADPSLWLAAGFEGLGFTSSLGAARLLAEQLLGRTSSIDPTPYLASRFTPRLSARAHQEPA
jgi:glycine/D-amino acid oxidase-like deaminating enzyme